MVDQSTNLTSQSAGPLDGEPAITKEAVSVSALPWTGKLILRGELAVIAAKAEKALGLALPRMAGQRAEKAGLEAVWLGPNEWLLRSPLTELPEVTAMLQNALHGTHHAVVEVTNYYVDLEISGTGARELINMTCPLDLRDGAFPAGEAWQTRMAKTNVLIHRSATDRYQVQVRWSMASYLWALLRGGSQSWA